jgi:hypothetical protein
LRNHALGTHTRASPSSTGTQPAGTPTPKWAFNCSAVNPAAERGVVVATVPLFALVIIVGEEAWVVWLVHPAVTITTAVALIRKRRRGFTLP